MVIVLIVQYSYGCKIEPSFSDEHLILRGLFFSAIPSLAYDSFFKFCHNRGKDPTGKFPSLIHNSLFSTLK